MSKGTCKIPPDGWYCTRDAGHEGPCAALPSVQPVGDVIRDELIAQLGDTYDCTRVWEAWSYGTMSDSDFSPVTDRVEEIADAVLLALREKGIVL